MILKIRFIILSLIVHVQIIFCLEIPTIDDLHTALVATPGGKDYVIRSFTFPQSPYIQAGKYEKLRTDILEKILAVIKEKEQVIALHEYCTIYPENAYNVFVFTKDMIYYAISSKNEDVKIEKIAVPPKYQAEILEKYLKLSGDLGSCQITTADHVPHFFTIWSSNGHRKIFVFVTIALAEHKDMFPAQYWKQTEPIQAFFSTVISIFNDKQPGKM